MKRKNTYIPSQLSSTWQKNIPKEYVGIGCNFKIF